MRTREEIVKEMETLHDTRSENWTAEDQAKWDSLAAELRQRDIEQARVTPPVTRMVEPQDRGFRSLGEFLVAVRNAAYGRFDPRLERRAAQGMNETTAGEGGYLVPVEYSAELLQAATTASDVVRRCRVIPMSARTLNIPAISETSREITTSDGKVGYLSRGGLVIYSLEEAAEKPASKPAITQVQLQLKKHAALVYVTDELLSDSLVSVEPLLNGLVAPAMAEYIELQVLRGSAASGQLTGIIDHAGTVSVSRATAGTVTVEDITNMYARLLPSAARSAVWIASPTVIPALLGMTLGDTPIYLPGGTVGDAPYGTLLGRPLIVSSAAPQLGQPGDLLLGDLGQYLIGQQSAEPRADVSIHVAFTTDETAFRWVWRMDGKPWCSAPIATPGGTTLGLFVQLDDPAGS